MAQKRIISIYCDGSSSGNKTGPIGWGWIVTDWNEIICAGHEGAPSGTNNIAELQAAIYGLKAVIERNLHLENEVELVSDSIYTLNLASGVYQPSTNMAIVLSLQDLFQRSMAKTRWVRGHSGDPFNEKTDKLAKAAKKKYSVELEVKKKRKSKRKEERQQRKAAIKELLRKYNG